LVVKQILKAQGIQVHLKSGSVAAALASASLPTAM
jgi:hypothetical protein